MTIITVTTPCRAALLRLHLLHVALKGTLALEGLTLQGGDLAGLGEAGGLHNDGTLMIAHSIPSWEHGGQRP
jgi:hypothetical protein